MAKATEETVEADWLDIETKVEEAPADHGDDLRLWLRILACSTLIDTEVRRRLREEFDFTLPRFDLLAQLERAEEGMLLNEISRRMMVSPGNLTSLVERMAESGHIKRTASPSDRRAQIITMTPLGRSTFRKMAKRHGEWLGELFSGITDTDRAALLSRLGKLKTSIRTALETEE